MRRKERFLEEKRKQHYAGCGRHHHQRPISSARGDPASARYPPAGTGSRCPYDVLRAGHGAVSFASQSPSGGVKVNQRRWIAAPATSAWARVGAHRRITSAPFNQERFPPSRDIRLAPDTPVTSTMR